MKKVLASVCGGTALVVILAGCDPHLAQIRGGSQEELWYKQLKANYPSFTLPPHPAPAAYNSTLTNAPRQGAYTPPAEDPEKTVDRAAEGGTSNVPGTVEELRGDKKALKEGAPAGEEVKNIPEPALDAPDQKKAANADGAQNAPAGKPYIVQAGDTLGGLAKRFYGKASLEDVIFRANSKVIKDRHTLRIGMRLVIPEL